MMCSTLNKSAEKEAFKLTLLTIDKSIEQGEVILKKFIKQLKKNDQ